MKRLINLKDFLLGKLSTLNSKRKIYSKRTYSYIQRKPFKSFFAVLGIFLVLMILGNVLFSPRPEPTSTNANAKEVKVFSLGTAPEVTATGKIEKSGVVKITAQTSGIVSAINVEEGQEVGRGTTLISLSTNYSGGNAATISRQIAGTSYTNAQDTNKTQKELIQKQREVADKNKESADKMREITNQSAIDSAALFDLNRTVVDSLSSNIQALEASNVGGANDALILQSKEQLTQFQSALLSTSTSSKNLALQGSSDLSTADAQYQIALKQLEIQEKAADMSLEITRLQYNLALVMEANMYPASPFSGTVDKIFVKVGDDISSGTVLATVSGFDQHVKVTVNVTANVAKTISALEPSTIYLGKEIVKAMPSHVSKDATSGTLYSLTYELDNNFSDKLTDSDFVTVKIPIGTSDASNFDPFIPLDSVVQTQEEAFVYVIEGDEAHVKKVTLGQVQGGFVEVLSGLPKNAKVITDRNVIEGDKVKVVRP